MATDATLTKTEKNTVFQQIVNQKFDPLEFAWTEETTQETPYPTSVYRKSVLTHCPTEYYFSFGGIVYECSPGQTDEVDSRTRPSLDYQRFGLVSKWLERVRQEYDAPDLWAMALQDRQLFLLTSILGESNTQFTQQEQSYIASRLDVLLEFALKSSDLTNQQRELITAHVEYTKEAAKRLGRFDWKGCLINTIITIVVSATFAPDRALQLWHLAVEAFMPLYKSVTMIP
jgi:hypothetical protein